MFLSISDSIVHNEICVFVLLRFDAPISLVVELMTKVSKLEPLE